MTSTDALLWAFVALACLAALALVFSAWPRSMKALLVIGVTALYFYGEQAFDNVWGQPSEQSLPERFVLLAAVLEEPGKDIRVRFTSGSTRWLTPSPHVSRVLSSWHTARICTPCSTTA